MSADKLAGTTNNRANTPARFITLNGTDGKHIINITYINSISPIKQDGADGQMESEKGKYKSRVHIVNGQVIRVEETTQVISQLLSADGVHGTSR
jgi:hypothetical protein